MKFSIRIGTVTGREIKKNRDSSIASILLQVKFLEDDVQTVQYISQSGDDTSPPDGAKVMVFQIGPAFKFAIGSIDMIIPDMAPGERKLYSTDSAGETIKSFIKLLNSGIIELNGNNDFLVRFNALETGLQQFVNDINTALSGKQDGGGSAGTLTLNISAAKVDEVKVI